MQQKALKSDGITELEFILEYCTPYLQLLDIVENLFKAKLTKLWVADPKAAVYRELLVQRDRISQVIQNAFAKL